MDLYVGIDLGTTYSSVAIIDEYGRPTIVKNNDDETLTPSVVYIGRNGSELVGSEAKEMLQLGEENVAMFFKRYMGDSSYSFNAEGRTLSATDLSAILLRKLKEDAERALGGHIMGAVITVPAYFDEPRRKETEKAGNMAGLRVLRLLHEPTAAAIAYGIHKDSHQRLLVYDLGGGTFDVTILQITPDVIKVVATDGDHKLGGKDWDDTIIEHVSHLFQQEYGVDPTETTEAYNDLAYKCERLKKQLSEIERATIIVHYNGFRGRYTVTREEFESMSAHLLRSTKDVTKDVLYQAGLGWADLDGVLLVGGSTRMPMVENWVREMSGKEPLHGVNVDKAVSLGAAIQANIELQRLRHAHIGGSTRDQHTYRLAGQKKIVDVMSHSLGTIAVSSDGERYVNSIIIQKNKPIPVSECKPYKHRTRKGQENELEVYLTQGESIDIKDCIVIGKYIFKGIEHQNSGTSIINIEYAYDENGIVVVGGTQQETGRKLIVENVPLEDDMQWLYEKPNKTQPINIIIAVDLSGSMLGDPILKARQAAQNFVKQIDLETCAVGIMGFAEKSSMFCNVSHDRNKLARAIGTLEVNGNKVGHGTSNNPLEDAYTKFGNAPQTGESSKALTSFLGFDLNKQEKKTITDSDGTKCILVVLTDGEWVKQKQAIKWSDRYREEGHDIIAVGFGCADKKFLERISTSSESALFTDLDHLVSSFGSIAQEIGQSGSVSGLRWNK